MLDRAAAQPQLPQLRMRHHSVLAIGKLAEETIHRARSHFDSYVMSK